PDLAGAQPLAVFGLEAVEVVAGPAFDLAALERQADLGGALVTGNELEAGAKHAVHHGRVDHRVGPDPGAAHQHLAAGGVLDRLDARRVPHIDRAVAR